MGRSSGKRAALTWGLIAAAVILTVAGALLTAEYFAREREYNRYAAEQQQLAEEQRLALEAEMLEAVSGSAFFQGIYVHGVDIGSMTKEQAKAAVLSAIKSDYSSKSLTVNADGQAVSISPDAFIIDTDIDQVLDSAYIIGRTGDTAADYAVISALKESPLDFDVNVSLRFSDADSFIAKVRELVNVEPQDAVFSGIDKEVGIPVIQPGTPGVALDETSLLADIQSAVDRGEFSQPVTAKTVVIEPNITEDELSASVSLMAMYQTTAKKDSNRNTNIALAMSAINEYILMPGETFSCNGVIGQRTSEKGYKTAGAIRNGTTVQELGGGVCQVSSTLFNAVARAGLEIVTRTPHSWPSDYIDPGMDATIDWPSLDFVFMNSTDTPVFLVTDFNKDTRKLTIWIYGKRVYPDNVTVDLRSERIKSMPQPEDDITLNNNMYNDEIIITREGRSGSEYQTYRQFFDQEGKLISEEKFVYSIYRARATLMTVGTKVRPAQEADFSSGG